MSAPTATDKHQIILNAAQKRFARFGLAKVTMDEIAQDIGMSKASLYYYFPTKETLYQAVIAREQDKFITVVRASLPQDLPAGRKLQLYLENRTFYLRDLLNLSILNWHSFYQMNPLFNQLYEKFFLNELEIVARILKEGKTSGEFRISNPDKTAEMLLHVLRGLRFHYLKIMDNQLSSRQLYEQLAAEMVLFTEIFLNGIKNPDFPV